MKKALTVLMAATFLLACYAPVYAADWDLYGSARVTTFWTDYDEEYSADADLADTTQLNHSLQGNSRIGAHVDAGAISGRFEYGTGVNVRMLYGTLDLGQGELLVGQQYSPYGLGSFISTQVYGSDSNMLQFIGYTGRNAMVQYSTGNFSVALVEPVEKGVLYYDEVEDEVASDDFDPEVVLPQLQARYSLPLQDAIELDFAGVIQSYDLKGADDETLTAWGLTANAQFTALDPAYVNVGGFYGQNAMNYGQYPYFNADWSATLKEDGSIEDTDSYGGLLVVGTTLANNIGLQAGVGYTAAENDEWAEDDEVLGYYVQANIPIIKNASITPEIGMFDYKDDKEGNDAGDELYAGLQWRVDF